MDRRLRAGAGRRRGVTRTVLPGEATGQTACSRNPYYDTASSATDDDELLPDALETSYSCSGTSSNSLNWVSIEETDVPARRAFWTWYLDEAIPQVLAG